MFWITTLLHKAFAHARISEARNQSQNGVVSESVSPFDLFMSVAQVIVSVNPYKQLNIYGDDVVKLYDNREVCMYVCVCVFVLVHYLMMKRDWRSERSVRWRPTLRR